MFLKVEFLEVIGLIIGLAFFLIGVRFTFFPRAFIKNLQNYKYKTTSTPDKRTVIVTIIIGSLLMLMGAYYTFIAILAMID
ncbi:MAG: hypothetical protein WCY80_02580 [Candidatus Izemoplasmatales bacterium]